MEAAATLADNLLDDLDDLSDNEAAQDESPEKEDDDDNDKVNNDGLYDAAMKQDHGDVNYSVQSKANQPSKRLLDNSNLQHHLEQIRKAPAPTGGAANKEQQQAEHLLIVQSNKHLAQLAEELTRAHGRVCECYAPKFPELEELLPNPVQYKNAVQIIGNELDIAKVSDALHEVLTPNQIITLSVAGSTTSGRVLTDAELLALENAVTYVEDILQVQRDLAKFVEGRMQSLAPSVCALVGPSVAAKLVGLAGGLAELSKIPACNLQVLGQVKHTATSRGGMSAVHTRPHQGILVECDLVQRTPQALRRKVLKTVAAKLALATRCDYVNVDAGRTRSDASGRKFREEIESKISKWQEPDKAPVLKSLPKPDLTIKKRRGGKRMRRIKERFEETAMMKQANTRAFSAKAGEYGDDAMGLTMGLLDTTDVAAGASLRKTTEKRKMGQANTKNWRKKQAQMSRGVTTSGLASSMVFTPVQGMELVNPDANKDRVREANKKWFTENAGFHSALPKK